MQYDSKILKITAGAWRDNGPQVTANGAWNAPVCVVVSKIDPRPTAGAAALTAEERDANAKAIAEVPRLIQALAMLLTAVRESRCNVGNPDAEHAAARALRRVTGVDQTPTTTRHISDVMREQFNEDGTP